MITGDCLPVFLHCQEIQYEEGHPWTNMFTAAELIPFIIRAPHLKILVMTNTTIMCTLIEAITRDGSNIEELKLINVRMIFCIMAIALRMVNLRKFFMCTNRRNLFTGHDTSLIQAFPDLLSIPNLHELHISIVSNLPNLRNSTPHPNLKSLVIHIDIEHITLGKIDHIKTAIRDGYFKQIQILAYSQKRSVDYYHLLTHFLNYIGTFKHLTLKFKSVF